jgi:hypothetical protein
MERTKWDELPDLKTSSMLFASTLEEHYNILAKYFNDTDIILDVGCGDNSFSRKIPNSTGVDENNDLLNINLDDYNTLHFSESLGYISPVVLERLISQPTIKKIIIKDFICTNSLVKVPYFNYTVSQLYTCALPLLNKNGYFYTISRFNANTERWMKLLKKHNMSWHPYPDVHPVIMVCIKPT